MFELEADWLSFVCLIDSTFTNILLEYVVMLEELKILKNNLPNATTFAKAKTSNFMLLKCSP